MSTQTVTIDLPESLYNQLQQAADAVQRSVSDVVRERLQRETPILPLLPPDVERELAAFAHLSDDLLWQLARTTLSPAEQDELAALNRQAQDTGLSVTEEERRQALLGHYQRAMVRRAEAARQLQVRGHDISSLFVFPRHP